MGENWVCRYHVVWNLMHDFSSLFDNEWSRNIVLEISKEMMNLAWTNGV